MGEVTLQKPPRGMCFANWGSSANRLRREMPAGLPAEAAISGVYYEKWGSSAHRLRRETAVGPADPARLFEDRQVFAVRKQIAGRDHADRAVLRKRRPRQRQKAHRRREGDRHSFRIHAFTLFWKALLSVSGSE